MIHNSAQSNSFKQFLKFIRENWSVVFGALALSLGVIVLLLVVSLGSDWLTGIWRQAAITEEAVSTLRDDEAPVIAKPARFLEYRVQPGDSSWALAERFYGDGYQYVLIEALNNLEHNQWLAVDQKLNIPLFEFEANQDLDKVKDPAQTGALTHAQEVMIEQKPDSEQQFSSEQQPDSEQQLRLYKVQPGDSWWRLAERELGYGEAWQELYRLNQSTWDDPNFLPAGGWVKLPLR